MAAPVKFLFDTEFSAQPKRETEPKVSLAEHHGLIALAREEGYAAGMLAGHQQAMASVEREQAGAFALVAERLATASQALQALEGRLEQEAIDIAVAVAAKLAESLTAREPMAEIRRLVGDCFANLRGVPHLVIRVHDDLLEAARSELTRLAAERGFDGRLVIMAEPTIRQGDCRIEWASGGIMLDRAEIQTRIVEAVQRYLIANTAPSSGDWP